MTVKRLREIVNRTDIDENAIVLLAQNSQAESNEMLEAKHFPNDLSLTYYYDENGIKQTKSDNPQEYFVISPYTHWLDDKMTPHQKEITEKTAKELDEVFK